MLFLALFSSCAVNYKSEKETLIDEEQPTISHDYQILITSRIDSAFLFKNKKIKTKLLRKGYQSFIVTITNPTNDTLSISEENLFVITAYEPLPILPKSTVLKVINLNRGLFIAAGSYGILSSFAYAGHKVIVSKSNVLLSLPIIAYGMINTIQSYRTAKNLNEDLNKNYIIGKKIMPKSKASGIAVVKSNQSDVSFKYKLNIH